MHNKAYRLKEEEESDKTCCVIEKRFLESDLCIPISLLESSYRKVFSDILNSVINEQNELLADYEERIEARASLLKEEKDVLTGEKNERDGFGICTLNEQDYIYSQQAQFIVKKGEYYFLFPEVKIGLAVKVTDEAFHIVQPPRFLDPNYKHPFVNGVDGQYCFGSSKPLSKFMFGKLAFSRFSEQDLAENVVKILRTGQQVVTDGMRRTGHKITPETFPQYFLKGGAEEAKRYGIPIHNNNPRE